MQFVSIEEAQAAAGLRMIVAGGFPSPWSHAAMNIFDLKQIDYLAVRFRPVAEQTRAWTGSSNVPVVIFAEEPPRTGWAEILMLAERLGGAISLVLAPLPHDVCPMLAPVRQAFESLDPHLRAAVPRSLLAHRDRMYERHLVLPIRF